jgi:hypothetical protein
MPFIFADTSAGITASEKGMSAMNIDIKSKPRNGIVYAATKQDRFIEEAFLSAESVKHRYPDLPITMFTDRLDHVLLNSDCFDSVETATTVAAGIAVESAEAKLKRALCLRRTPYDRTLYLDTDTQVVTNELMSLFDLLDEFDVAMVETSIDDSYSRLQYGRPMFNTGVILYRRNHLTLDWLLEWAGLSERNFRWASRESLPRVASLSHIADESVRRSLLNFDQIAMVEILSPEINKFDLAYKILEPAWNYRGSQLSEKKSEPPKILHMPREKMTTHVAELKEAILKMNARMAQQMGKTAVS